jgi:hypothetical protein
MQAAVLHEFGPTLSVEEVPRPVPGPDDVLIEVEVCGVCHSDLHVAEGDQPALKGATKANLIPGHEVVGRVVERGANVTHLARGRPCRRGLELQHLRHLRSLPRGHGKPVSQGGHHRGDGGRRLCRLHGRARQPCALPIPEKPQLRRSRTAVLRRADGVPRAQALPV